MTIETYYIIQCQWKIKTLSQGIGLVPGSELSTILIAAGWIVGIGNNDDDDDDVG